MKGWKKYILSSVAGVLTIGQFALIFFFSNDWLFWLQYVGYGLWGLSAIFGWLPIYEFRKKGRVEQGKGYMHTTKLVDTGIFAIVRHPQYTAWPLLNIGLILIAQHWLVTLVGIVAILFEYPDFRKADQEGIEKFGDEYRQYMKQVPGMNFIAGFISYLRHKKND